jgi:hypothetical protein
VTLEQEIDRLCSLPLAEFIATRNGLAKSLRAAGDRGAADRIKALAKPSVTAWAVNSLYHHQREPFDALRETAAAVRTALASKGDRRQAEAARRKALQELLGLACKLLQEAEHAATSAARQRISHTLETLTAQDPEVDGPRPGQLVGDLEPQGFDVLAGLAASLAPAATQSPPTGGKSKRPPGRSAKADARTTAREERLVTARGKVEECQATLAASERAVEAAETAATQAAARHERLMEEAIEAERQARTAAEEAATAKSEATAAKAALSQAKTARRQSLSRLATARRRLERLEA